MIVLYDNTIFGLAHNIMVIRYAFVALTEKVEELTLYIIQQQKEIDQLRPVGSRFIATPTNDPSPKNQQP
jgi:hypothetical protein